MITRDEWLKAVEDASAPPVQDPDAMTTRELSKLLGCQQNNAGRLARRLVEAGKAVPTTKMVRRGNGWYPVPAFKLVKP